MPKQNGFPVDRPCGIGERRNPAECLLRGTAHVALQGGIHRCDGMQHEVEWAFLCQIICRKGPGNPRPKSHTVGIPARVVVVDAGLDEGAPRGGGPLEQVVLARVVDGEAEEGFEALAFPGDGGASGPRCLRRCRSIPLCVRAAPPRRPAEFSAAGIALPRPPALGLAG